MPDISQTFAIPIRAPHHKTDPPANIYHCLNFSGPINLRLVEMVESFMPRRCAVPRVVWNKRDCAGFRIEFCFRNKFRARAVPPMTENYRCEWPFSFRNDEISSDRPALRTGVSNVVDRATIKLFNDFVVNV